MKIFLAKFISFFCQNYFRVRYFGRVKFGKNIIINHRFKFSGKGKLEISDKVNLWAHDEPNRFQTYDKNAQIFIGKNTRLNGVLIQCREKISIGDDCLCGSTTLMDHDFHTWPKYPEKNPVETFCQNVSNKKFHEKISSPITIKSHVWLAGQSVVLKDVTIEEGTIVGFRAVVTKNCPRNSLAIGNPAQIKPRK